MSERWQPTMERLERIDWAPRFEHTREAITHLKQYLQRQSQWAQALARTADWPSVDVADALGAPPIPSPAEARLEALLTTDALGSFTELACRAIVRWAMLPDDRWRAYGIESPWEPLLRAFEVAGAIRREHRFLQAGLASVALDALRPERA